MLVAPLLSLTLLTLAGLLLDAHRRDWGDARAERDDEAAFRFAATRFRRRTVATATIALVGVLLALWPVTPREPAWVLGYAGVLATLAVMIFTLGVCDAWASSRYYRALSRRRVAEQTERLRRAIDEGRAADAEGAGA